MASRYESTAPDNDLPSAPGPAVEIPRKSIEICRVQVNILLSRHPDFIEIGGYILGTFDRVPRVSAFDIDLEAEAGGAGMRFSSRYYDQALARARHYSHIMRSEHLILGTWHLHPQWHGPQYSDQDVRHVFMERMQLKADIPTPEYPAVHVIFDQALREFCIYTMKVGETYTLHETSFVAEASLQQAISESLEKGDRIGAFGDSGQTLAPYHRAAGLLDTVSPHSAIGFWRYATRNVDQGFKFDALFFENFRLKTGQDAFFYVRASGDPKQGITCSAHEVKRQPALNDPPPAYTFIELPADIIDADDPFFSKLILQNPDTAETIRVDRDPSLTIENLKRDLAHTHGVEGEITLFTWFNTTGMDRYGHLEDETDRHIQLPDRMAVEEALLYAEDLRLPIYFRNTAVPPEKLYELRTERFRRAGYDVDTLAAAKIFLGGVGLLGSEIACNLATVGIGAITVVDNGEVDWFNLFRQPLFLNPDRVYQNKADVAAQALEAYGGIKAGGLPMEVPCGTTIPDKARVMDALSRLNALVNASDVIVGAFDTFAPRVVLQLLAIVNKKPFVSAALDRREGKVKICRMPGPCFCCGMPHPKNIKDSGLCTLAFIEAQKIVGGLAAKAVVDLITCPENIDYTDIHYLARTMDIQKITYDAAANCPACGHEGLTGLAFDDDAEKYGWLFEWLYG